MAYQNPINIYDQDFDWNGQAISNIYRQFLLAGGNEYLYTGDGNLRTDVVTRRFTTFDVTLPQTQGQGFLFEGTSFLPSPLAVGRVYQFDTHNLPYYSHPGNQWWLTFGIWNGTTPPTELTTETLHVGVPGQTGSCVLLTISENIYNTLKQNPTHKLIAYWGNWGARTQYYSPEIIIETGKPTTQANDLDFRGDLQPIDGSWLLKGNLNHGISHSMATTYGHAQGTSHLVEAEYSHVEGSGSTARSVLPATNQNSSPITPDLRWLFVNNFGPNTDGRIAGPILTNPGSGYTTPFVQGTVAGGGGTGAQVFLNINTTTGQAEGVFIQAQGSGYSSPTVTFPTPQVGQTATATIVANQRSFILGNQQREDDLLQFCTDLNINALVLMDLGAINWNNPTPTGGVGTPTAGDMNAFLQKVKSTTEIQHVSFALEYDNLVTVDNRNYTPLIPIGQYNNYPSSGVNFRQADSFTWFLKYWPATDNPPAGYFYPNISDTIDLGIQAGVIPPGFAGKQNIYIPDVDSYLIYISIRSTPSAALQRVFMEANTNVSVTDVTGTYEALRGSAFTGANAKSLPKFASALNRSFFNNTPFKPIVPVLSSNRITNPWNGNGGYNGSINTVVPAYRREYMGSFFQTGSIQQAYDNLTRLVNYTYILPNTKWSYETDSKTTSTISIREVAVSNYFLLSASTTAQSRQAATDPPVPTITQGNSIANHIQGVSNQTQLSTNYTHVEGTRNIAANTLGTHMAGADNLSSGSMYSNIRGFSSSIIPQSTAAADHVEGGLNKVVGSLNYSHVHSYNSLVQGDAMHIHGERIIMSQSVFDRSVPETTALNTTITPSTASFATSHIAGYNNTLQIQPFIACTNVQIEATRATSIPDPAAPEYPVEIINYSCNFYFSKEYGDITSFVQSTFVNGLVSSSAALAILGLPLYAQGYNKPQEHSALSVDNIYTPTPYWPAYTASTWSSLADFVTTTYDGATGRTVLTINAREGQNPLGTWIPSTLATTVGSIPSPEKPITAFVQGEDVEEFYLSLIWKGPHIVSSSLYNTYSDIFNRQVATNTANHINASGSLTTLEAHNNNIHTGDGNGLTAFTSFAKGANVHVWGPATVQSYRRLKLQTTPAWYPSNVLFTNIELTSAKLTGQGGSTSPYSNADTSFVGTGTVVANGGISNMFTAVDASYGGPLADLTLASHGQYSVVYGLMNHAQGTLALSYQVTRPWYMSYATVSGKYSHAQGVALISNASHGQPSEVAWTIGGVGTHTHGDGGYDMLLAANAKKNVNDYLVVQELMEGGPRASHIMGNLVANTTANTVAASTIVQNAHYSHIQGTAGAGIGSHAHSQGGSAKDYSHTHGRNVSTTAQGAHAQGSGSSANANFSHAEGLGSVTTGDDAHSEGTRTTAGGVASHAQGSGSVTAAPYAHAEGVLTRASGPYAHSEGFRTTASGTGSHAQGQLSIASNPYSNAQGLGSMVVPAGANVGLNGLSGHAEGSGSTAGALSGSHAEGVRTLTTGFDSHTEGSGSVATGTAGHAEGVQTTAGNFAHSQGLGSVAAALYSHTEGERSTTTQTGGHSKGLQSSATGLYASAKGSGSVASGQSSHAEGATTTASGIGAHAEGIGSRATGNYSHAEGLNSTASGLGAHAEGIRSTASSTYAHAEGSGSVASGIYAHAQGQGTLASSLLTTAEGLRTTANLTASHAQGQQTVASGRYSHAEGLSSIASAETAFAEGQASTAASRTSHAEGFGTRTSQIFTHTEGALGVASGLYSHAEGGSGLVDGIASHREGTNTRAAGQYSHAEGVDTVAGNLRRPDRTFMYVTPFISRSDGVISDIVLTNTGSGYQTLFVTGSITNATGVSGSVGLNIDPVLLAVSGSGSAIGAFIFNQGSNYQYPITVTFPTPTSPNGPNVAATASLYINQITPILGIPAEEDALLTFCDTQKINSLILYDLNWMDWAENGQGTVASPGKAMLKDFIVKAKTSHDVDHISAARGFDTTGSGFTQINQIRDYNIWAQENGYLDGLFDSITTEVEWWQAPIPISASHVGIVLNYADRELRNPRTTRLYSPMEINVYLGKGSNYRSTDPAIMAQFTDRWLVSTYVSYSISTGSGNLYRDTKGTTGLTRMADIATAYQNFDVKPKILPIYSAESKFSPWNKNGGFNGVNLNTWNADNDYEFMGRYYSPRFANRSLQRSYEDWTVWISSGVNTVWDRETDPLLLNNLQAEGIALFEYKLLSQSMPGITNPQNPNILIQRDNMHSEGKGTTALGFFSHTEGEESIAYADFSYVTGWKNKSFRNSSGSIVLGYKNENYGQYNFVAGGLNKIPIGDYSVVVSSASINEASYSLLSGKYNYLEGEAVVMGGLDSYASLTDGGLFFGSHSIVQGPRKVTTVLGHEHSASFENSAQIILGRAAARPTDGELSQTERVLGVVGNGTVGASSNIMEMYFEQDPVVDFRGAVTINNRAQFESLGTQTQLNTNYPAGRAGRLAVATNGGVYQLYFDDGFVWKVV